MKKRTVILGTPVCVVWRSVLAGVVFVILLCGVVVGVGFVALSGMMQTVNSTTSPGGFFSWYWGAVFGVFVIWWWLSSSSRRFRRRFVKFDGRVCLRCKREIEEGNDCCLGCGAWWSLDDLNTGWRKLTEGKEERSKE